MSRHTVPEAECWKLRLKDLCDVIDLSERRGVFDEGKGSWKKALAYGVLRPYVSNDFLPRKPGHIDEDYWRPIADVEGFDESDGEHHVQAIGEDGHAEKLSYIGKCFELLQNAENQVSRVVYWRVVKVALNFVGLHEYCLRHRT